MAFMMYLLFPLIARCACAGLLMALLTERCLFVNFPFYQKAFAPELDFDWGRHQQRLLSFGHDVTKTPPYAIQVCHDCPAAERPQVDLIVLGLSCVTADLKCTALQASQYISFLGYHNGMALSTMMQGLCERPGRTHAHLP